MGTDQNKQSPLPWAVIIDEHVDGHLFPCDIVDANGESIFHDGGSDPHDYSQGIDNPRTAARIVACMNALKDWPIEEIDRRAGIPRPMAKSSLP